MERLTKIWVALDVPTPEAADGWIQRLRPHRHFKVGLELFVAAGPAAVSRWAEQDADLFLDLKLHDIPNTVARAVRQVAGLGVRLLTVHAAGGAEMLRAAQAEAPAQLRLAAVTVLTSLDTTATNLLGVPDPAAWAWRLARLAAQAGVACVVTSGQEAAALHQAWPQLGLVVPGVRPEGVPRDDQARVITPQAAVAAGATDLVVGRPVLRAADPVTALSALKAAVDSAERAAGSRT